MVSSKFDFLFKTSLANEGFLDQETSFKVVMVNSHDLFHELHLCLSLHVRFFLVQRHMDKGLSGLGMSL